MRPGLRREDRRGMRVVIFSGFGDFKARDHPGDGCGPEGRGCIVDGGQ